MRKRRPLSQHQQEIAVQWTPRFPTATRSGGCPPDHPFRDALATLRHVCWFTRPRGDNPFANTGMKYDGTTFSAHAYAWPDERTDDPQEWNFRWHDLRASWYKHCNRGLAVNRKVESDEVNAMMRECLAELVGGNDV